jgi:hypothetical protein
MATKRKALSKKTRFDVFKRDGFVCQYCGAHPPSAILEVDHIQPVAFDGTNDMDNLITSCFDCNRGKSDRQLSDIPQSLQDKAAEVLEREAQIKGYQSALNSKKSRISDEAEMVCDVYERFNKGFTLSEKSMVTVRMFVDRLGVHEVCDAMERAHVKARKSQEFRYFCGICWAKIRELSS